MRSRIPAQLAKMATLRNGVFRRKKNKILNPNIFSGQGINMKITFCTQIGEKTVNLAAAMADASCSPIYVLITADYIKI